MTGLGFVVPLPPSSATTAAAYRKVLRFSFFSRLVLFGCMVVACQLVPDFYSGDDVLQFDLRLDPLQMDIPDSVTTKRGDQEVDLRRCFCLSGHACDESRLAYRAAATMKSCADASGIEWSEGWSKSSIGNNKKRVDRIVGFYRVLLTPLTRWDGARFLTLAVDPGARDARYDEDGRVLMMGASGEEGFDDAAFASTEQAHAFFPLVPLCIRLVADMLMFVMPLVGMVLPPTYEAVSALAALILNTSCFVVAAMALHDLTFTITLRHCKLAADKTFGNHETSGDNEICLCLADVTTILFCLNPAGVFFVAAYSESIFAALTFTGHAIAARGHFVPAALVWAVASYARSNGTMSSIWLLLVGIARSVSVVVRAQGRSKSSDAIGAWSATCLCLFFMTTHCFLAALVALPVVFHDWRGYTRHCYPSAIHTNSPTPTWCTTVHHRPFSLYGYVQRKHWNVGFLRYYELKQIPNFLLATPILVLGFTAAMDWIRYSWENYLDDTGSEMLISQKEKMSQQQAEGDHKQNENLTASSPKILPSAGASMDAIPSHTGGKKFLILRWAVFALSSSDFINPMGNNDRVSTPTKRKEDDADADCITCDDDGRPAWLPDNVFLSSLLSGPYLLAHYAVLTAFCIVGSTVAHVQISTRLICSSCPALYWFMTKIVCQSKERERLLDRRRAIIGYCFAFNILGVLMHVNWLPWT